MLRYLNETGAADYRVLRDSGLLDALMRDRLLVATEELAPEAAPSLASPQPRPALVLQHEQIPFISYSYEWPFELLRAAALKYLHVMRLGLAHGFVLKDASTFNSQFMGSRPTMIDVSSFERYEPGRPWAGYAQFCRMFLNPLLLQALVHVPYQRWLRSALEGIEPTELAPLLPLRRKLRRDVLIHVVLHAWLNRRLIGDAEGAAEAADARISQPALLKLIAQLEGTISGLRRPKNPASRWSQYEQHCHYDVEATAAKERFVESVLAEAQPATVWDFGCNQGQYSAIAARHSAYVVALDSDESAVGQAATRGDADHTRLLPLVIDLANPSPDQGWAQVERAGLRARGPADFALCLALVHHLAIPGGVPLSSVAAWFAEHARSGVIEFVPPQDPMVRRLLVHRAGELLDYDEPTFRHSLERQFIIRHVESLPRSDRTLYVVERP